MLKRIVRRLLAEFGNLIPARKPSKTYNGVIVSLTSYSARLKKLHIVIRSLLKQKVAAEKIILYLGTDTRESDIPKKLKDLTKYSFEIKTGCQDLKPHKKYFFSMQEYPEHTIITVDDDAIYDKNLVCDLVECSKKHPGCVVARRVHRITVDRDGSLNPYAKWKWEERSIVEPSHKLIATGCGGVLYPPHILPKDTFDSDSIREYCLDTDDIWLKFMELKNDVKVVFSNNNVVHPLSIRHSQDVGLFKSNTSNENRNDINIEKMRQFTGVKLELSVRD